jgi:hypothetical protein
MRTVAIDHLTIYYKTDETETWNVWKVYKNNQTTWLFETIFLPEDVKTETIQICFEGKINGGYGICLDNISIEKVLTSDIKNIDLKRFKIYPNPTNGVLTIQVNENTSEHVNSIEIFDIYGRVVETWRVASLQNAATLDISHLTAGIYFIKIENEFVGKFIKN